jgi:hypothetical protein
VSPVKYKLGFIYQNYFHGECRYCTSRCGNTPKSLSAIPTVFCMSVTFQTFLPYRMKRVDVLALFCVERKYERKQSR